LNAIRFVPVLLAWALLTGCPAYTLSGMGTRSGRDIVAVRAEEPEVKLRCEREDCNAIDVARPYQIDRSAPAFWLFALLEAGGAGVSFFNAAKLSSDNAPSSRVGLVAGAGGVALAMLVADLFTAGSAPPGTFTKKYNQPHFQKKFHSATWSGLTVPIAMDDVVPGGSTDIPATFSVRDAADRRGLQPGQRRMGPSEGKLAVLDFKANFAEIDKDKMRYFTDVVRSAALKAAPNLDVITRENLEVLVQASGKSLEECEGQCEVDTGRLIGADVIVSGDIVRIGSQLKLTLRLYETKSGRLLGSELASGVTEDDLDRSVNEASVRLLSEMRGGQ
jgi:hypothetical protein